MRWLAVLMILFGLMLPATTQAAPNPQLTVSAPQEGALITGSDVTIRFTVSDFKIVPTTISVSEAGKHPEVNKSGEGHLHFVLDLQPLVVWTESDAYTFRNVPPGEHQLMVELANNDHSSLSPRVMQIIRFKNSPATTLPRTGSSATGAGAVPSGALLLAALIMLGCGFRLRRSSA